MAIYSQHNKRQTVTHHRREKNQFLALVFLVLLGVCCSVLCLYFFNGEKECDSPVEAKDVHQTNRRTDEATPAPLSVNENGSDKDLIPIKDEKPAFVKRPGALQLPNGDVITFKPPAPGKEKIVWVHGHKYIADSDGNFYDATPTPTFDNKFENVMESMSAVGNGVLPATALSVTSDEIAKYMSSKIVIEDDDPEDIVEKKIATAEMKELFRSYLKDGGNWEDFVMELNNIKRNERLLQGQAISEIARMLIEGDEEGAQLYRSKVDQFMKSKGYRGLKLPTKWGLGE